MLLAAVQRPRVFVRLQLRLVQLRSELAVLSLLPEHTVGTVFGFIGSDSR